MLTTSVAGTVVGLYLLISYHLREILILSEIKNNQVRAGTIAEITTDKIQIESSNVQSVARMISAMVTNEDESIINEAYLTPAHL